MPNGMDLSDEEFKRQDSFFSRFDAEITRFARQVKGGITRQHHGYPLRWIEMREKEGLSKRIDLTLVTGGEGASPESPHLSLSVWAIYDTSTQTFIWVESVARSPVGDLSCESLAQLLQKAWDRLGPIDAEYVKQNKRFSRVKNASSGSSQVQPHPKPGEYLN